LASRFHLDTIQVKVIGQSLWLQEEDIVKVAGATSNAHFS